MNEKQLKRISKFISLLLRHQPEKGGLTLDAQGWTETEALLKAVRIPRELLERIVAEDEKLRYSFSSDGLRIRANQGHSVAVDLGYPPVEPPAELFHGTPERNRASILEKGLLRGNRTHVHLCADRETAEIVGRRRGLPIIFRVDSAAMHRDGCLFFRSENGVWLTEHAPPQYLSETDPQ